MVKSCSASRRIIAMLVLIWVAVAAVALAPVASAGSAGSAGSSARDYGSLTARWWQWVYAQPAIDVDTPKGATNTNPVLDTTGKYAAAGQKHGIGPGNKYFFLAGTFGGEAVRTVTVPRGKRLFFPIFNIEVDNAVEPPTHHKVPKLRELAKASIDQATVLEATFDGRSVRIFRSASPVFSYTVPDENSIYDYFGSVGPQFEGRIKPAVADGYWATIPPLTPGRHSLNFHAEASSNPAPPEPDFMLDVTYNLTTK